jgi:hypothetical protein
MLLAPEEEREPIQCLALQPLLAAVVAVLLVIVVVLSLGVVVALAAAARVGQVVALVFLTQLLEAQVLLGKVLLAAQVLHKALLDLLSLRVAAAVQVQ